ncbi:MAG: gliding motility-associated C-terminal domain-containing protein [Flavobacteriales bacterium]|nr:MAG: gliding motility-associated C-terminal domain-containing protein [Flavobacteriales bacterium]
MMKRLPLVTALLTLASTAFSQGGPDCTSAAAAPLTLPFNGTGLTNCGSGDDYDSGNATICGSALYMGGEDQLYAFTPTSSGVVTINLTSGSSFVGMFLYAGCPGLGGACAGQAFSAGGSQFIQASVTAGTQYFLMVDSWPAPSCHPNYDLAISAPGAFPPPTSQDCFGSIPVCQSTYQELNSPVGEGNYPNEINDGTSCLGGGEVDGQWYTFTVQNAGNVCFSITPNDLTDDYDWAVYDLTNNSCADIFNTPGMEISCNFSGLAGVTGANGLAGGQNEPCIPVVVGQTLALYISNWSQSPNGYTVDFGVGGATASIFDLTPPSLDTLLSVDCSHTELEALFSEFVLCSSVQTTDFTLTGPGGPYTIVSAISGICNNGGNQDNTYVLTVAPPLQAGTYTLELVDDVEDLCGNIGNTGTVTFTLDSVLDVDFQVVAAGCGGADGQVLSNAIGGLPNWLYELDAMQQLNNGNFLNVQPGTYTLTVTDGIGCSVSEPVTVGQALTSLDNDSLVVDASCNGLADGTITIITTGNGGPWDYEWTDANGTAVQTTLAANGDTFTGAAGTYTVIVYEGINGSGCSDTLSATIYEPVPANLTVSNDTLICLDGTAALSASGSGGAGGFTYTWDQGLVGNGPHNVDPPVNTTYAVFGTDANGCVTDTLDIDVSVQDSLQFSLVDTVYSCAGVPIGISAQNMSGGDGQYNYQWTAGQQFGDSVNFTLNSTGTVCVTLTDGCETPAIVQCVLAIITPVPELIISVDTVLGCEPLAVNFSIVDTTGQAQVTWTYGDGSFTVQDDSSSHTYGQEGIYDLTVEVEWPNGCESDSLLNNLIQVLPQPEAGFLWAPQPTTVNDPVIVFDNQSLYYDSVYWDFGGLGGSTDVDPAFEFPNDEGDVYDVELIVANFLGCADTLVQQIIINDDFAIWVPNAFTPDGDGTNDQFFVGGTDIDTEEFELLVFDRWGEVIFKTNAPSETWNGGYMNASGFVVQDGVYPWKLRARSATLKTKKEFTGHVSVLK